ncbi:MAG: hypothetical protein U9N51_08705 [Bacteroidota bacterium]|nr:hypothetical protein [Bacteroidota bacterium]
MSLLAGAQSTWVKQDLSGLALQRQLNDQSPQFGVLATQQFPNLKFDSLLNSESVHWLPRVLFYENLIKTKTEDYAVSLNPVFNFQYMKGNDFSGYVNTRGFHLQGHLKERIFFTSSFSENQGRFPGYLTKYAEKYAVLPGYARMKPYNTNDWDFASALGSVHFVASKNLQFRIGHDKLFVGSGHRSLFLSDAAFQQLFLQTDFQYRKFCFTNLSMQWMNPNFNNIMQNEFGNSLEGNYPRKFSSIHILQYAPNESWNISLIEAVVFQTDANNSPFAVQMINPFILSRSFMLGFHGNDNLLLGADVRYNRKNAVFYMQFVLDNLVVGETESPNTNNRYAYQIGAVFWDVFDLQNLHLRLEHNYVTALCYAHENPEVSYTHYNQNLAHPKGSNFAEILTQIQYRYKRIPMHVQLNYFLQGTDSTLNETLAPIHDNYQSAYIVGEKAHVFFADFEAGYYINPAWRSLIFAGLTFRKADEHTVWIRFGLRTNLGRRVRDF